MTQDAHRRREQSPETREFRACVHGGGIGGEAPHGPHFTPQTGVRPSSPETLAADAADSSTEASQRDRGRPSPGVPGYELLGILSHGHPGDVYKARQLSTDRVVALKILPPAVLGRHGEAQLLAAVEAVVPLQHPNILPIYDVGQADGSLYIASELVEGGSLAARMAGLPQSEQESAELVEILARTVQFCHERRIAHFNLKPTNVLFTANDVPRIADFGMAAGLEGRRGQYEGDPTAGQATYLAPEQVAGHAEEAGPAADLYALGAILYELLTGRPPFLAGSPAETVDLVVGQEPVPPRRLRPRLSAEVEVICLKCLQKRPERRYATAAELAEDLRRLAEHRPIQARGASPLRRIGRWCRQNVVATALLAAVAASLVVGFPLLTGMAVSSSQGHSAAVREKARADENARQAQRSLQAAEEKCRLAEAKIASLADSAQAAQRNARLADANARVLEARAREARTADASAPPGQPGPQIAADTPRSLYVMQLHLAKQAWDRGDTRLVRQILEPYRTEEAKQKHRDFAWYYLWRATNAGGTSTLREHSQPVRQVAFTPDGAQAVTLGDDGLLVIWDAASGKRLQSITLEQKAPATGLLAPPTNRPVPLASGLEIARDGWWVATCGNTVWTGNLAQPVQFRRYEERVAAVTCLAVERHGKLLAIGDEQGEILVRQLPEGSVARQLKSPRPRTLTFTPDGKTLLAGTNDGNLLAWDMATGSLQFVEPMGDGITSIAVSPDGQTVAAAMAEREGVVRLWDLGIRKVRAELRGHNDVVTRVVFSPEGKFLLTASRDQTVRLWSVAGGLQNTFKGHTAEVAAIAFSPDGQKILTGAADQTAILWNADSNQECDVLAGTPAIGWINGLAFTPGSDRLIAAGCGEGSEPFLSVWSLADLGRPFTLRATPKSSTALGVSPDARLAAIAEGSSQEAAAPSRVRIWSLETGRVASTLPGLTGCIRSVAYSPDGKLLATALGDPDEKTPGQVKIWETATNSLRQTLPNLSGRVEATFSPDGRWLVTVTESTKRPGDIRLWNPATGELTARIESPAELENLTAMALSPDGQLLVTGHGDPAHPSAADKAKLKLWDLGKQSLVAQFPAAHPSAISRVAFSRRGKLLASGDVGGNLRLWDFPERKLLPKQLPAQTAPITSLSFDFYGDRVATSAEENCIRVWHIDTAAPLAKLDLSTGTPAAAVFTPDGYSLVATTTAGGVIVWDAENYRLRGLLHAESNAASEDLPVGEITCAVTTTSGKRLITGGGDKTLRLWDLTADRLQSKSITLKQAASCLAVFPEGKKLAVGTGRHTAGLEPGEVFLCQFTGREGLPDVQPVAQNVVATGMAVSPNGDTLAVCGLASDPAKGLQQTAVLYDMRTGKSVPLASSHPHSLTFSPDGKLLAVGRATGDVELWSLDAFGSPVGQARVLRGHANLVASLAFSPDGKTLASGSHDQNVRIWDVATGEELLTMKHNGSVEVVRFSPDGTILASADRGDLRGTVRLWRAAADTR